MWLRERKRGRLRDPVDARCFVLSMVTDSRIVSCPLCFPREDDICLAEEEEEEEEEEETVG